MEGNSQLIKDIELIKDGWIALYLKPFEIAILGDDETGREVHCRYYVDGRVGIRCKAPGSEFEVFSKSTYDIYTWSPPGVGLPEAIDAYFSKDVVKSEEIRGRLRRYRIGDFYVIELRAGRVFMIEAWRGEERLFTRTVWLHGDDAVNGATIVRLFKNYMPMEQAIDAAIKILCDSNCDKEWLRWNIKGMLTLERIEFPDTPLVTAVRFGPIVEKVASLTGYDFEVRRRHDPQYGEVAITSIPVACNYYNIWLKGGRRGFALLCTANKPSHMPRNAAMEVHGAYLLPEPLWISYFDDGATKCVDVGDRCLSIINHVVDEEGVAVERGSEIAQLKIVETKKYKAYYVDVAPILTRLFILEVDRKTIGITAGNIDELEEKIRDVVYQNGDEALIGAAENALMYVRRRF